MDDGHQVGKEPTALEPVDKRWIVIVAAVAISGVLFALLIGSIIGDVFAYLFVFVAGWIVHAQWLAINRYRRRRTNQASGSRARPRSRPAPRTTRSERPQHQAGEKDATS
jgi:hypothetical protein